MTDKLLEIGEREFAAQIQQLFDHAPRIPNTGMLAEIPVVGGQFFQGSPVPGLLQKVCKALVARERFRLDAPGWPCLPLHEDIIKACMNADDSRANILGLYSRSLN